MCSDLDEFTFPVLVAGRAYAVHSIPGTLRTVPASLADSDMYNGTWVIDSSGKGRRVKKTVRATTKRRLWDTLCRRDVLVQFVFEDGPVVLTVSEVKALLFDGFGRVSSSIARDILAELRTRVEPAQTLSEIFHILSEEQEGTRRTL